MLKLQSVLVAYDGSPASERAVEAAVEFAREGAPCRRSNRPAANRRRRW